MFGNLVTRFQSSGSFLSNHVSEELERTSMIGVRFKRKPLASSHISQSIVKGTSPVESDGKPHSFSEGQVLTGWILDR